MSSLIQPLTQEQEEIVKVDFKNIKILLVNAYAGTGKTSTLVDFCEVRKGRKILYMAYNNSMAKEAKIKFKHLSSYVVVKTTHSLAYAQFGKNKKSRFELGNLRAMDLMSFCGDLDEKEQYYYAYLLLKLIREFCNSKLTMQEYITYLSGSAREWGRENRASLNFILDKLPFVWEQLETDDTLPYEHDFYLKKYQLSKPKLYFDFILVDEAQDINGCIIDIVLNQTAKKVFIGDTYQSIYKFRGATDSLEKLSNLEGVKTLFLTQSFRCPRTVSAIANQYLDLLRAPRPFKGTLIQNNTIPRQVTVIARTNAKLFDFALENIDQKLYFVGGIKSYNFQDLIDMQNLIWGKTDYIRNGFIKKFQDLSELEDYATETNEVDLKVKITTVKKYMKQKIYELVDEIKSNLAEKEEDADLILTTGHKSKGLEWDHVEILDDFTNLKEILEGEDELVVAKEELNLLYVAITRSKQLLSIDEDYIFDKETLDAIKSSISIV